jgi:putative oxidoreductase
MSAALRGPLTVLGRLLLCAIFFLAAVGNKIPHFSEVAKVMESVGIPAPQFLLAGAIVFLLAGSFSVIVGYRARAGAVLLLTFLVLASYYFHPFWKLQGQAQQEQMIQFMKNLSMMGAMLFVLANGSGPVSLDAWMTKYSAPAQKPAPFARAG